MADDIVISGRSLDLALPAVRKLHSLLDRCGLSVNEDKWNHHGIQDKFSQEGLVHSISVEQGHLCICRQHKEHVSRLIDQAIGACQSIQLSSLNAAVAYRRKLHGWSCYASQTNDPIRSSLSAAISICDAMVTKKLRKLQLKCRIDQWWMVHMSGAIKSEWLERLDWGSTQCFQAQLAANTQS